MLGSRVRHCCLLALPSNSGLLIKFEFALQIMSRQQKSSGDRGKAPTLASPWGDLSSSDVDTILANEQVARTLWRCFDRGGDDIVPSGGMHIAHRTRSQCLVKMANASS